MSMLAEPRRKQKVINLRAKNNAWSNDSSKFGQRMLEKMGWSSGKGLGAKENGIVEHVVARYKNDEKGLGFEDRNDQWTKNEDDFNTLLANLSNADSGTDTLHSGISLEKKSKKSKARIHYHKFTRGKDLSRYSEKDLANIFGKKSFKEPVVEGCIKEDTVRTTEQVFTEKGNMDDYFKSKLAAIKSKSKLVNTSTTNNDESDYTFQGFSNSTVQELETNGNGFGYQPFSFYSTQKDDVSQNNELTCLDVKVKSKKKKKSKQKEISSEAELEENNLPECTQDETEEFVMEVGITKERKSRKKNHRKEKNQEESEIQLPECMQEAPEEIVKDIETTKIKKSKKKKHQECVEDEIQPCEQIRKKKKKNKNHGDTILQEHSILSVEASISNNKKKRKCL